MDDTTSLQPPNPSGLCQCGCGGETAIAKSTVPGTGAVKGEHNRFLKGHQNRGKKLPRSKRSRLECRHLMEPPNPSGKCQCGCGGTTSLAKRTARRPGNIAGEHQRFIRGHHGGPTARHLMKPPNPSGMCQCGCGRTTGIAKNTDPEAGSVRGEHVRFIRGHQNRDKEMLRGSESPNWKGGRHKIRNGYIVQRVFEDDPFFSMSYMIGGRAFIQEHRLILARRLGRPLDRSEHVHHINGVRDDNRIENLQLVGHHGSGQAMQCRACGSMDVVPAPRRVPET